MLFAQTLSGSQLVALGFLILATGLLLRRGAVLSKRSRDRDVLDEVRRDMQQAEQSGASLVRQMEVRLHDYDREIGGRMQTTIAVLDQLMVEADREIERLEHLLKETSRLSRRSSRREPDIILPPADILSPADEGPSEPIDEHAGRNEGAVSPEKPLTAEQCRGVRHLNQAGFTIDEIARCLDRPREQIASALRARPGDNNLADAA